MFCCLSFLAFISQPAHATQDPISTVRGDVGGTCYGRDPCCSSPRSCFFLPNGLKDQQGAPHPRGEGGDSRERPQEASAVPQGTLGLFTTVETRTSKAGPGEAQGLAQSALHRWEGHGSLAQRLPSQRDRRRSQETGRSQAGSCDVPHPAGIRPSHRMLRLS